MESITIDYMGSTSRIDYVRRKQALLRALVVARREAGVSQAAVARALSLKQPDVSKIESGERRLDVVEFLQYIECLSKKTRSDTLLRQILLKCDFNDD